jgi:hypothetical protein
MKFIINKEGTAGVGAGTETLILDRSNYLVLADEIHK